MELTYASHEMIKFANDLGFEGPPFAWDEDRHHCLKSELDAIFAHMYGLDHSDLEWILDVPAPNSSLPVLKSHEMKEFGEYRTKQYVPWAFDQVNHGKIRTFPDYVCQIFVLAKQVFTRKTSATADPPS